MTEQLRWQLSVLQAEQVTPDVPLPGLKQKGKEAEAIGKAPAQSGPGASDQVTFPTHPLLVLLCQCLTQEGQAKHAGSYGMVFYCLAVLTTCIHHDAQHD